MNHWGSGAIESFYLLHYKLFVPNLKKPQMGPGGDDDWWPDCPIRFLIPRITPDLSTPKSNGKKMMAKILMIESYQSNRQYFWLDRGGLKYLFRRILTKDEAEDGIFVFMRMIHSYKCQRPITYEYIHIYGNHRLRWVCLSMHQSGLMLHQRGSTLN